MVIVKIVKPRVEVSMETERKGEHKWIGDLTNRNALLKAILQSSQDVIIFAVDPSGTLIAFNQKYKCQLAQIYKKDIHIGMNLLELIPEDNAGNGLKERIKRAINGETFMFIEVFKDVLDETVHWEGHWAPIIDEYGNVLGVTCFYKDITEFVNANARLARSEVKFAKAFHTSPDSMTITTLDQGIYLDVNEGFCKLSGFTYEDVIGHSSISSEICIWKDLTQRNHVVHELEARHEIMNFEADFRMKSGKIIKTELSARLIEIEEQPCILMIARDITERLMAREALKQAVEEKEKLLSELLEKNRILKKMSEMDDLTNLFNRRMIINYLENEIERFNRYGTPFSMIMFDLDHFKRINDQLGHVVGDEVLVRLSLELKNHTRRVDIVGRYGGEEFLLILPNTKEDAAYVVAEKIRLAIENMVWQDEIQVTISGGVLEYDKQEMNHFIHLVDQIMYHAKEKGRNRIERS